MKKDDEFLDKEKKILKESEEIEDIDDIDEDDIDEILDDIEDDDINDFNVVTNITNIISKNIKTQTPNKSNKKPKFVGKHTLTYDTIHNSKKVENETLEEEYYINDINHNFEVSHAVDTGQSYSSDEYYFSHELKQKVFDLLVQHTDIDFSPDKKRRIPSINDLNSYYKLLIDELVSARYSYTEIFISLSEFFSDKIWNVYKKMNSTYKDIIIKELQEKYDISEINEMDFL